MEKPDGHSLKRAIPINELRIETLPLHKRWRFHHILIDPNFIEAETFRDQIKCCLPIIRNLDDEPGDRISYEEMGNVFGIPRQSMEKHCKKAAKIPNSPGRPPILPSHVIDDLLVIIFENFKQGHPVHYHFLIDILQFRYQISIFPDTLRHVLRAHPDLKTVTGIPMERARDHASPEDVDRFYNELEEIFQQKIPTAFVYNVDESGSYNYSYRREIIFIVQRSYEKNSFIASIDKNSKRSTFI